MPYERTYRQLEEENENLRADRKKYDAAMKVFIRRIGTMLSLSDEDAEELVKILCGPIPIFEYWG